MSLLPATPKPKPNPLADAYDAWRLKPGPDTVAGVLTAARPVIDTAIRTHASSGPSPTLRGQAKDLVISALPEFDPQRAQLQTFLTQRLQRLSRLAPQEAAVIHVPERVAMLRNRINGWSRAFEFDNGREPTMLELSREMALSPEYIAKVQRAGRVLNEGLFAGDDEGGVEPRVVPDAVRRANVIARYVYDTLEDPHDRLIMERTTGLFGRPKLPSNLIAKQLRISPSAVSQRTARLQKLIDSIYQSEIL